jgi:myo-inositol-1(or 4)-monophosphatase
MQPLLNIAIQAARRAGEVIVRGLNRLHRLEVRAKGENDFVSEIDTQAEREIIDTVHRRYPQHDFLAEESGQSGQDSEFLWIIDPLDGTTNFAHGLALFCVSLALEVDGRVEIAVVYDPIAEELFTAERGHGARLNGQPIRVSERDALVDALLCTGFPYTVRDGRARQVEVFSSFLGQARAVRRLGSAALDLCYVAAGRFDGFWEEQLHPWDIAAGALIVQEAGGWVTSFSDEPVDLFRGQIVASNGRLHGRMLSVIN